MSKQHKHEPDCPRTGKLYFAARDLPCTCLKTRKAWAAVHKIAATLKKDRNAKIPAKLVDEANEVLVDFNLML